MVSQKLASGLDSATLLPIPFFILSGNIMNRGRIARRLINFDHNCDGSLPGSLAHCNILANVLLRAISGSSTN
ncbi:TRAP transporter large permease subunit [Escherichia coli]|uniref:TRAP transporter large permease subunit n=1 Tax=Escherichia coli TaxID=562 RepID=UPI0039884710